jgi:hypothetical protein
MSSAPAHKDIVYMVTAGCVCMATSFTWWTAATFACRSAFRFLSVFTYCIKSSCNLVQKVNSRVWLLSASCTVTLMPNGAKGSVEEHRGCVHGCMHVCWRECLERVLLCSSIFNKMIWSNRSSRSVASLSSSLAAGAKAHLLI